MAKNQEGWNVGEANGGSAKGKANGSSAKGRANGGSTEEDTNPEITFKMISDRFKDYIIDEKPGLQRFYKSSTNKGLDKYLKEPVERALNMVQKVMENGCPWEAALSLSLIALYDIVMLLDNSLSMKFGEEGKRLKTLHATLKAVSAVYSLAAEGKGINAVRLLNSPTVYYNVGPGNIKHLQKELVFEGLTNIGTKLRGKVLTPHAGDGMTRPLLVIVITDGQIEGEAGGLLRQVIEQKAEELREKYDSHGPQAVAYQFAKIGNDKTARDLVKRLDDDDYLGDYIDCLVENQLEGIWKKDRKWEILPKLLLGAISKYWDAEDVAPGGTLPESSGANLPQREDKKSNGNLDDDGDDGFGSDEDEEDEEEGGESKGGKKAGKTGGDDDEDDEDEFGLFD